MTIELPVLRLGLAGFSAAQQEELGAALSGLAPGEMVWELDKLPDADAWWINGARSKLLLNTTVRVSSAVPTERALQLHLPDIDRPVAFSLPLACPDLKPAYSFDPTSPESMTAVLEKFESWLSPLAAQFCLASHIVEHETALGSGVFDVRLDGRLLAVVNMHGPVGVLPGVGPADFENAEWRRCPAAQIPEDLVPTSMSQLMWQYSLRTQRDLLPRHYRTGPLYFRRPPRLPSRMLRDSHLLLLRELAAGPASFEALQQSTGLRPLQLARDLAALYFVGAITSNPKRAAPSNALRRHEDTESAQGPHSSLPSGLDSVLPGDAPRSAPIPSDLTAPAPMGPR
ncbi:MAG: hypothetical protein JWQ07_1703 [Ramlibacter sp.]|nr:hypothetical protein [Ramlibacter sp.]